MTEPQIRLGSESGGAEPIVIGLGGASDSIAGIEQFFARFPADPGHAVVIVLQHREALDVPHLREALEATTGLALVRPSGGDPIEGGKIYLCAPNTITTLQDDIFHVRQAEQAPGARGTIDSFLVSLAESRGEEAIGIVFAGTNGDGTLGVATLKDQGGMAVAERPPGEEQELTDSKSPSALADFVLRADDIAEHLVNYLRHRRGLEERKDMGHLLADAASSLTAIAEILRKRTGNDFHGYKPNTFFRRIQRRMQVVQIDEIGKYVAHLNEDTDEVQNLFNDLLIGVTQFFRDKREFEILEREVIPRIFEGKEAGQQVRVWVLGCATGEEAYSIGILLREHMAALKSVPQVQIFATDIDGRALAAARVGRYRTDIEADVTPERLARWFVREGDTYCVVRELREMCVFSQHNVIKDAPFSRLDLVSCRNLLIYLNADLQTQVIPLFHFGLLPDRYLFLGNSENVTRHPKLFVPVDRRARIFKRLETGTRLAPEFPITRMTRAPRDISAPPLRNPDLGLERRAQRVAERYSPAYVIVDERFNVLHFSGRTGRYLEPTSGAATLDLMNLVHRDLRVELRSALARALEVKEPVQAGRVQIGANGDRMFVDMTVEVLEERPGGARNLVVIFKEGSIRPDDGGRVLDPSLVRSEQVDRLEAELRSSYDRLQSTIEELESTNEELKSSNEEYQSLNEELQSANEELETSREELQSVNEELTTVNNELRHRVQELTRATSDIKNLLEATKIATLFLDNELRVMNFTPAASQVLHLVETDIARPIAHIKAKIPMEDLYDDVRHVLRTLASVERELTAPDTGTRFIVRILPYRSVENYIAGAVVTFVDVTAITRAEERTRILLAELQHRVRNTLGVVRSIARRTAETSGSVDDFAMHLDGRLMAFARTQSLVTRDPEGGVDLEFLIADELQAYRVKETDQVRISGPSVRLQPKAAETLGLAIHELATNAVKYGALSNRRGSIEATWSIEPDGEVFQLAFEWRELDGPQVDGPPARRGFGTELLERTLSYELKARTDLSFQRDGLRCSILLPLTSRTIVKPASAKP